MSDNSDDNSAVQRAQQREEVTDLLCTLKASLDTSARDLAERRLLRMFEEATVLGLVLEAKDEVIAAQARRIVKLSARVAALEEEMQDNDEDAE